MREIRLAVHLLACQRFVQKSVDAMATNISADVKQFDKYPTLGADVEMIIVEPDTERPNAFGNCPAKHVFFYISASNHVASLQSSKRGQPAQATGRRPIRRDNCAEARRMAGGVWRQLVDGLGQKLSSGIVRVATDAASDNRGHGSKKATMDHIIESAA
jgi:hypothetical protein